MARLVRLLPYRLRARAALRQSRRLLRSAFAPAEVRVATRRGVGTVTIASGIFCDLREPWAWPTCRYYAAAIERHLALLGVPADVAIETCQATADGLCRIAVTFRRPWRSAAHGGVPDDGAAGRWRCSHGSSPWRRPWPQARR